MSCTTKWPHFNWKNNTMFEKSSFWRYAFQRWLLFLLLSSFLFFLSSFLSRLFVCLITMKKCVSTKMQKGRKYFSFFWNNMKNQCCSFFCCRSHFQKIFLIFLGRGRGGPRKKIFWLVALPGKFQAGGAKHSPNKYQIFLSKIFELMWSLRQFGEVQKQNFQKV